MPNSSLYKEWMEFGEEVGRPHWGKKKHAWYRRIDSDFNVWEAEWKPRDSFINSKINISDGPRLYESGDRELIHRCDIH